MADNLAGVPAPILDGSEKEAGRIFSTAGIYFSWAAGPSDAPEANMELQSSLFLRPVGCRPCVGQT
jgi:hypothetical protein